MTNEQRIQANADKGYILVAEFDGWEIVKKQNEVGGWTYYSNQIGNEGYYILWDTAVQSIEELQTILADLLKPTVDIPDTTKTWLEINGIVTRLQEIINKKLEKTAGS